MTVTEAGRLATALTNDPSSHTYAALAGWAYPVTREWLLLADWFDFDVKPKVTRSSFRPHARPWSDTQVTRHGTSRSAADVAAALAAHGHTFT